MYLILNFKEVFLKKLEITGFKSFAKKTVLDFSSTGVFNDDKNIGITTIVGPNGSGKSNIADALRWVLGEQSSKNLRSKKSEDVIFAGSGKKAKLGSAQVSIHLDNLQRKTPVDYEEIVIPIKFNMSKKWEGKIYTIKTRGDFDFLNCPIKLEFDENILKNIKIDLRPRITITHGLKTGVVDTVIDEPGFLIDGILRCSGQNICFLPASLLNLINCLDNAVKFIIQPAQLHFGKHEGFTGQVGVVPRIKGDCFAKDIRPFHILVIKGLGDIMAPESIPRSRVLFVPKTTLLAEMFLFPIKKDPVQFLIQAHPIKVPSAYDPVNQVPKIGIPTLSNLEPDQESPMSRADHPLPL